MGEGLVSNVARVVLSCTCLARIIHEGFYCNRRYVAATSLTAAGSPLVSRDASAASSRTLVNNAG